MRTTIVPAQITTVEDKIAGNLTMTQIILLLLPLIFGSMIYLLFPPEFKFSLYKLPIIAVVAVLFACLAIRIKGKIIMHWIAIIVRYNSRPRYFIANKNDLYLRDNIFGNTTKIQTVAHKKLEKKQEIVLTPHIAIPERMKLEHLLPKTNMSVLFNKKGELYVRLSEIKK